MKFILKNLSKAVPTESFHNDYHTLPEGMDLTHPNNPIAPQANQYLQELHGNLGTYGGFKEAVDNLSPGNLYGTPNDVDEQTMYPNRPQNMIDEPENNDITNLIAPIFNRHNFDTHHIQEDKKFSQDSKAFAPVVGEIFDENGKVNEDNLRKHYADDSTYNDFRERNSKIIGEGISPSTRENLISPKQRFLRQHLRWNPNDKPKDIEEIDKHFKPLHFEGDSKVFKAVDELLPDLANETVTVRGDTYKIGDKKLGNFTFASQVKNPFKLLKFALMGYNAGGWYADWEKKLALHSSPIIDEMDNDSKSYIKQIIPRFMGALGQSTGVEQNYQALHKMVSRLLHNQLVPDFVISSEGGGKSINPEYLNGTKDISEVANTIKDMSKKGLSASLSANGFSEDNLAAALLNKDFKTPKIMDYVSGFLGRRGGAMDMWMLRMMFGVRFKDGKKQDEEVPDKREYDYMLGMVHHLTDVFGTLTGKKYGTNAVQAMLWVGYKQYVKEQRLAVIDKVEQELSKRNLLNNVIEIEENKKKKKSTLGTELSKMRSRTDKIAAGGTVDETLEEKGVDKNNPRIQNLSSHSIQNKYSNYLDTLTSGENPIVKTKYKDIFGMTGTDEDRKKDFSDFVQKGIDNGIISDISIHKEKDSFGKEHTFLHGNHEEIKKVLNDYHVALGHPRIGSKGINDNPNWFFNQKDNLEKVGKKNHPLVFTNELKGGILPQLKDEMDEHELLGHANPKFGGWHVDINPEGMQDLIGKFQNDKEFFNDMVRLGKNVIAHDDTMYREFNPETGKYDAKKPENIKKVNVGYTHPFKDDIEKSLVDTPPVLKRIALIALKYAELKKMDIGEIPHLPLTYTNPEELQSGYTDAEHPLTKKGLELDNERKFRITERIKESYQRYLGKTQVGTPIETPSGNTRSNVGRITFAFFGIRGSAS